MDNAVNSREEFYREARYDITGPLQGVRVLEITTTWAGPRCGSVLADLGAEVIRIELAKSPDISRFLPPTIPGTDPPDGHLHAEANKNKRSICIDLRQPEGLAVFMKLLPTADVVVENFKKGTLASYGCGYEDCRKVKPDIIYVSVTGFGQFGPYSGRPGYDPAAQAYSGFMYMNARSEKDEPLRAPTYLADELTGLHAGIGALGALRHRDQTGEGQHVDVSLLDATINSSTGFNAMAAGGVNVPRVGNPFIFAAPSGIFRCTDGHVYAGVLLDAHWKIMCEMIGRPELATDPHYATFQERIKRRAEVDAVLGDWCATRTRAEVVEACEQAKIAVASVNTLQEAAADRHVQYREAIATVQHQSGNEVKLTNPAVKYSRTPIRVRNCAPMLGQDTDSVLGEAGIDEEERKALRKQGVIF